MLTLRDRRNRLSTESVELVECLHNWLLSGLIDGVLTQMDVSALMDLVFSIAISNIKKRWITIDFDELWSEIVN